MLPDERRQRILELIETDGSVSVDELAQRFDVSEMTIRRDLRMLDSDGLLRRVHGGATSSRGRSYEPPFLLRTKEQAEAKARIGELAAEMISDGDSVALDVGTTTLEVARHLEGKQNLTIVTPSLHIANVLAGQPGIRLILTGGILRPGELSLVGHLTERAFKEFHVDKLFLGIGGISFEAGLTEFNLEDALTKRAMLRCAKEYIVVADASKFGQIAFAAVAPLSVVHKVVTDSSLDSQTVDRLQEMDIEVVLA
ncbi:MAG: DeoR/GlpR family DNA-binding transcription regulator [Anaerolineae bacterium]